MCLASVTGLCGKVTFATKRLLCNRLVGQFALVAQLDRASDFESEGRGFESLRARQDKLLILLQKFAKSASGMLFRN